MLVPGVRIVSTKVFDVADSVRAGSASSDDDAVTPSSASLFFTASGKSVSSELKIAACSPSAG